MEQSQTQEEQVRHQWNQQLADKEAQIRELQDKLDSVLQPRMSSARSRDELETISDNNEGGLVAITKQLKHVLQTLKVCTMSYITYIRSLIEFFFLSFFLKNHTLYEYLKICNVRFDDVFKILIYRAVQIVQMIP